MAGKHSEPLRGLSAVKSQLFQGRFGRMFRNLPPAQFGRTDDDNIRNLEKLGHEMAARRDPAKDGPDGEESGIPALYTYLGQFIDHDITFDPMSDLMKKADPDGLVDFRSPAFDLDNVYGRGPDDQPYMYDGPKHFLLGAPLTGGSKGAKDLPRGPNKRALIGDPRNDENSIVSQLQGLFLRFHNRLADEYPNASFGEIQQLVRFHYQYIVLHDFLPRIINNAVLDDLKTNGNYDQGKLKFYHWKSSPFMPVEFSVAAYRLGHSMIRPGYRLNDVTLLDIFPPRNQPPSKGLTGFLTMVTTRGIDWGRFIDIDIRGRGVEDGKDPVSKRRLQFAYRLDTSLVDPLAHLPDSIAGDKPKSLAQRNLLRGWRLGLPSGQDVARAMGVVPLADDEILIAKAVENQDTADLPVENIVQKAGKVFAGNCPLWTYVLAEAMHYQLSVKTPVVEKTIIDTPQLGPVGGRIVAEVFLGLLFADGASLLSLNPFWTPKIKNFALKDFVNYALGRGPAL